MATDIRDLILRDTNHPPYDNKGDELTLQELDCNFITLGDVLREMIAAIDVETYDGGTTYTEGDTVKYGGQFWEYVNDTDQSGITPGTDSEAWIIATIGSLIHRKGSAGQLTGTGSQIIYADQIGGGVKYKVKAGEKLIIPDGFILQYDYDLPFTVQAGGTLQVDAGGYLVLPETGTLTNHGSIINNGYIDLNGGITNPESTGTIEGTGTIN